MKYGVWYQGIGAGWCGFVDLYSSITAPQFQQYAQPFHDKYIKWRFETYDINVAYQFLWAGFHGGGMDRHKEIENFIVKEIE